MRSTSLEILIRDVLLNVAKLLLNQESIIANFCFPVIHLSIQTEKYILLLDVLQDILHILKYSYKHI